MKKNRDNYFENNIYIGDATKVSIGEHCHINENCFLQGVTIGNYVLIAPNLSVINSNHKHKDKEIPIILQGDMAEKNPIIEDNVWVGRNVVILPNTTIEEGSIVGAGAVVTKNVKKFTIVGGIPAKFIKERR
jgi:maltose O-acetyltransferase